MGDTSKYMAHAVNVRSRKDKSRRSYVSFGDLYFEIEFIEACFGRLVISFRRFDTLRIKVEDMKMTCW